MIHLAEINGLEFIYGLDGSMSISHPDPQLDIEVPYVCKIPVRAVPTGEHVRINIYENSFDELLEKIEEEILTGKFNGRAFKRKDFELCKHVDVSLYQIIRKLTEREIKEFFSNWSEDQAKLYRDYRPPVYAFAI